MRFPQYKSPLARATMPVVLGIGFFALMFAALWGVAAVISGNSEDTTEHLTPSFQEMGRVEPIAQSIAEGGPIILPDLVGDDRHIVLDHTGNDPQWGWAIYLAHPSDRDATCAITLVRGTRQFTDCDGRTLGVDDLASPPKGVTPIVNKDGTLTLSLRALPAEAPTTTSGA
jgi:hypothetical protein